jgi:hypothetical protein
MICVRDPIISIMRKSIFLYIPEHMLFNSDESQKMYLTEGEFRDTDMLMSEFLCPYSQVTATKPWEYG